MNDKSLLIALFALLEREGAVSVPQAARLLGSSEETVWRLLEELVFAYDSVFVRLELGENFARLVRPETTQMLRLTADETAVLLDALRAHGFTEDDELVRKLAQAKGFLGSESASGNAGGGDAGAAADAQRDAAGGDDAEQGECPGEHARAGVPGIGASMSSTAHAVEGPLLMTLAQACEAEPRRLLEIEYHKDGDAAPARREVEPYALRAEGDHSYLEAYDLQREGWRSFRADRIRAARILERTFSPRPRGEGEGEGDPAAMAVIRFEPGAFPQDWKRLRRMRMLEDGSVEARIPWYGSMWLPKKIVAMQGAAKPMNPPELRKACETYARDLLG